MAGLQLQQLHTACLGLETAFNTALQAASLTQFTDVYADPPTGTPTAPYLVVTLGGWRRRERAGIGETVQSCLRASFRIVTAQGENEALAYEGVVAGVLRDSHAAIATAVTDADLTDWQLERGTAELDEAGNWVQTVRVRTRMEW